MRTDRDTTRIVRSWLDEGVGRLPDRVLDEVLDQLPATPQRKAWAWMIPAYFSSASLGLATAVVLLVAIIALRLFVSGPDVAAPVEGAPSPTPSPSPMALPPPGTVMAAGTYVADDRFPVRVTFEVTAGWSACDATRLESAVCHPNGAGVGAMIVDNVVADPCDSSQGMLDPPIGPSVTDLVTAISNLPGFQATESVEITRDGFAGREFRVTAPTPARCPASDIRTWSNALRINGVSPGEVNLLQVLDVNGVRLLLSAAYHPATTSAADLAEIRRAYESMHVAP